MGKRKVCVMVDPEGDEMAVLRFQSDDTIAPVEGRVRWSPGKSLWLAAWTVLSVVAAPFTSSWTTLFLFLGLTGLTLCAGHSVGMHRCLIHRSFACPKWLEYVLVYLGVLVGMAGPTGMIRQHDLRDWAQRQAACHPYLRHDTSLWRDYFWQCHADVQLDHEPAFRLEPEVADDPVYRWLERTWMLQQLPIALLLWWWGGWPFVIWGVAVRITVGVTGHWMVGHFAHHHYGYETDNMNWEVRGAAVQGRNVPLAGLISMGEAWHNNHHAYPGSAKIGLKPHEPDPGWWLIKLMERVGVAWNIVTPEKMPPRAGLHQVGSVPQNPFGRGADIP